MGNRWPHGLRAYAIDRFSRVFTGWAPKLRNRIKKDIKHGKRQELKKDLKERLDDV